MTELSESNCLENCNLQRIDWWIWFSIQLYFLFFLSLSWIQNKLKFLVVIFIRCYPVKVKSGAIAEKKNSFHVFLFISQASFLCLNAEVFFVTQTGEFFPSSGLCTRVFLVLESSSLTRPHHSFCSRHHSSPHSFTLVSFHVFEEHPQKLCGP